MVLSSIWRRRCFPFIQLLCGWMPRRGWLPVAVISTVSLFSRKSPVCGQNRMNDRRIHRIPGQVWKNGACRAVENGLFRSVGGGGWLRLHRFRKTGGEVAPLAVHMGRFCGSGATGLSILVGCRYLTRSLRGNRHVFPSGQVFRFNICRVKCSCRCRVMGRQGCYRREVS